ncbi:myocilin opposite strand protein [Lontra canadensis]|uniref:myocilin opposite strand protein n=1 Tax=Lontra canadensis TaxID=76717 RepID=UPI0013F329B1|nr:myocilin opposite strand protein [Lontra canadensis]
MAQKSPAVHTNNLPYGDLASEVTRRRVTMATGEEISTKISDEAGEMSPTLDSEQGPAGRAGPSEPPAPPPSPAEDCRV